MNAQRHSKYPFFDWDGYYAALHREARVSANKLGADRTQRRLGIEYEPFKDNRTEDEIMADKALVTQGQALERVAWDSVDEVKRHVVAAYGHGPKPLSAAQISAVVAIAWSMQLDPAPGTGHIQVWEQGGRLRIEPGYQGYIFKAQQQRQMFYNPPRAMTNEEREMHGLKAGEVGAVCELYEMGRARWQKELGLPVTPIVGIAVWKPGNNVANGRTPFWMACKNAIKDAIRQLGLGFSATIPQIEGFAYDHHTDSWEEVKPSAAIEGTSSATPAPVDDKAIEGEIMNALATSAESAAAAQEPAEVVTAPETEVKAEEPAPAAAEVVTPAAPDTDLLAVDVSKLLKLYAEARSDESVNIEKVPTAAEMVKMLKNVVKDLSDNKASDFLKAVRGKDTLGGVSVEEWRGLLAVINSKPDLMVIAALTDKKQAAVPAEVEA